jgi:hypothetical protein
MKTTALILGGILAFGAAVFPVRADTAEPTAFEKALYDKARYQVVTKLNDDDFVSYCITMNVGGDTLLKIHDDILFNETKLNNLLSQGLTGDQPQVLAVNAALRDLRSELAVKVSEARKGLEVESRIAEETLTSLSQYQK